MTREYCPASNLLCECNKGFENDADVEMPVANTTDLWRELDEIGPVAFHHPHDPGQFTSSRARDAYIAAVTKQLKDLSAYNATLSAITASWKEC